MNLKGCLFSPVLNDLRSYSSKSHEEMARGKHLEMESRHSSSTVRANDEMPIKSVWSLKVSSFRYQVLWRISFIPNPSTLQASQVEVKQGLRRRDPDSEICTECGSRVTVPHAHPAPSCHSKLSTYPLPITYSTPGPDDMCKYLFCTWHPKTESKSLISCGFHCLVAAA